MIARIKFIASHRRHIHGSTGIILKKIDCSDIQRMMMCWSLTWVILVKLESSEVSESRPDVLSADADAVNGVRQDWVLAGSEGLASDVERRW